MAIGNTAKMIEERQYLRAGETELSERQYNWIIGGVLLWGFGMNFLMVSVFGEQIVAWIESVGVVGFLIGYLVMAIAGSVMIAKGGTAVCFLGYNMIALPVGLVVCACVSDVPVNVVESAVLVTAIVTLSFMILAGLFPDFFLSLGRVLGVSLLLAIVAELIAMFLFRRYSPVFEWLFVGIFSLYIGYDWARANQCARTVNNAVTMAAALYLDIINLFLRILEIMSRKKN